VGREKEISELIDLLQDHRLVTLTGPGGVGKTRLALEVAQELLAEGVYPDGIYFVELAPLQEHQWVGEAVLDAIGLRAEGNQSACERLLPFLEKKSILLFLDNFEHLLEAVLLIANLLEGSSGLWVLATSREALNLSGEQVYRVQPLEIDPSRNLFIQRAQERSTTLNLTIDDFPVIDQICAQLDQLPLAVELAAARLNLINLQTLSESLVDRFQILTEGTRGAPDRHQTLQKAIEWSYQLLSDEERALFRRLAVFQGRRTLDAVQRICCSDIPLSAVDGLTSLLNKSLIRSEEGLDGEVGFYLLETIHDFALEKLQDNGEETRYRDYHARYFVDLVERAAPFMRGGLLQADWYRRLSEEKNNLSAVFEWIQREGDELYGLRIIGALLIYFSRLFSFRKWRYWTIWAKERVEEAPDHIKAAVYTAVGALAYTEKDFEKCRDAYLFALQIYMKLDLPKYIAWSYKNILTAYILRPEEKEEIQYYYHKAIELFDELDDQVGKIRSYINLGICLRYSGLYPQAEMEYQKALDLARDTNDPDMQSRCLINLGCVKYKLGKQEESYQLILKSIQLMRESNYDFLHGMVSVAHLAGPLLKMGYTKRTVIILGAVDAFCRKYGIKMPPEVDLVMQEFHQLAEEHLEESDFCAAWAEGQAMSYQESIEYALDQTIFD
jgi:non-specific serine/threonine protein kinase